MTKTLFTNARLIDPVALTDSIGALLVTDGVIAAVYDEAKPDVAGATVLDCNGMCLAPGIIDIGVKVSEPGERHKESFAGICRAPRAVGCACACVADGCIDQGARRARDDRDRLFASRALTYAKSLGALVIAHVQEPVLSDGAVVTSGKFASLRGLPGVSPMAERMGLDRDISLLEMTGAAYHADQITTARALPALERAKRNGLDITAGIGIHHLTLNELDVADYRTFFKLKPPLRSEEDRLAVVQAVDDGLIDIICSMHTPQDEESKRLPYEEAASAC